MTCGIYCIENKINKKKYIGKSINIENRWKDHKRKFVSGTHKNPYLQHSWEKYGANSFSFLLLESCEENQLNDRETLYIKNFETLAPKGYNFTIGGRGVRGYTHSEERRKKISKNTPRMYGEEHPFFGKHHSKKTKLKLRERFSREKSPVFGTKHKESISRFFGVGLYKQIQTIKDKQYINIYWTARIRVDKKDYRLGYFKDEILAAKAYDDFVIKNNLKNPLNFPEKTENLKI